VTGHPRSRGPSQVNDPKASEWPDRLPLGISEGSLRVGRTGPRDPSQMKHAGTACRHCIGTRQQPED